MDISEAVEVNGLVPKIHQSKKCASNACSTDVGNVYGTLSVIQRAVNKKIQSNYCTISY